MLCGTKFCNAYKNNYHHLEQELPTNASLQREIDVIQGCQDVAVTTVCCLFMTRQAMLINHAREVTHCSSEGFRVIGDASLAGCAGGFGVSVLLPQSCNQKRALAQKACMQTCLE